MAEHLYNIIPSEIISSSDCRPRILSLLCVNNFLICGSTPTKLIQPTYSECAEIKYQDCENEWEMAAASGILLPDCETFYELENISCPYIEVNKKGINIAVTFFIIMAEIMSRHF